MTTAAPDCASGTGPPSGQQFDPLQLELPERRPVQFLAQLGDLGAQHRHAHGLEVDGLQQLRHVHELRRQAAPEHVVRGSHDLDARGRAGRRARCPAGRYTASPGASEIRFSSSEISTPGIAGVLAVEADHGGQLRLVRRHRRAGDQGRHDHLRGLGDAVAAGDQPFERGPQGGGLVGLRQVLDHVGQERRNAGPGQLQAAGQVQEDVAGLRAAGRKPHSASNGVSAKIISGLWLSSR